MRHTIDIIKYLVILLSFDWLTHHDYSPRTLVWVWALFFVVLSMWVLDNRQFLHYIRSIWYLLKLRWLLRRASLAIERWLQAVERAQNKRRV